MRATTPTHNRAEPTQEQMLAVIAIEKEVSEFTYHYFTTYQFQGWVVKVPYGDGSTTATEEQLTHKMLGAYKNLHTIHGTDVNLIMWKNRAHNGTHFHVLESSNKPITKKSRAIAMKRMFAPKVEWFPKDVYKSFIQVDEWDGNSVALHYGESHHDRVWTKLFTN